MTTSPLHTYTDDDADPQDVAAELRVAAKVLDETAGADIHNERDMICAAVALRMQLRNLVAALDAERGEGRG